MLRLFTEKCICSADRRSHQCYLRTCLDCSETSLLEVELLNELEEKAIEEVHFEQWLFTDRCNIEDQTLPSETFALFFSEKLQKFIYHDYIKQQQSNFLKTKKESLIEGEIIVICDFAENYSFVLPDEVQAYHWNNSQCTIHPFVVYYKANGELKHLSFVVISDIMLFAFLRPRIALNKCIFMSDGAPSQYKNRKNLACICAFEDKHKMGIEWHFFATSHGKGPQEFLPEHSEKGSVLPFSPFIIDKK